MRIFRRERTAEGEQQALIDELLKGRLGLRRCKLQLSATKGKEGQLRQQGTVIVASTELKVEALSDQEGNHTIMLADPDGLSIGSLVVKPHVGSEGEVHLWVRNLGDNTVVSEPTFADLREQLFVAVKRAAQA